MQGAKGGAAPTIQCVENGPYVVKGLVTVKGEKGQPIQTKPVMALCRCGGSKTKPFCDGTHSRIGFRSD